MKICMFDRLYQDAIIVNNRYVNLPILRGKFDGLLRPVYSFLRTLCSAKAYDKDLFNY